MLTSALFARALLLAASLAACFSTAHAQMMGDDPPSLPTPKADPKPAPSVKPLTPTPPAATKPAAKELEPFAFKPALERSWAVPGSPIVIPIRPLKPLAIGGPVTLQLAKSSLPARILFYAPAPGPKGWMDYAAAWSVSDKPTDPAGFWAIVATLPPGTTAQAKLFDEPLNIAWTRPPSDTLTTLAPKLASLRQGTTLASILRQGTTSPVEAWRCDLLLSLIDKDHKPAELPPGLNELRAMNTARWSAAFTTLAADDPKLALALLSRLTRTVDFGPADAAPLWPIPGPELSRLLDDLLDPALLPRQRTDRASAWLASQPRAIAWTLDDAGLKGPPDSYQTSTIALAELSGAPGVASFSSIAEPTDDPDAPRPTRPATVSPELTPLAPGSWLRLVTPAAALPTQRWPDPAARVAAALAGTDLNLRVGRASLPVRILARPVPIIPPGFEIGPLVQDWSLSTLTTGMPSVEPDRTVGKLSYDLTTGLWQLAIEATLTNTPTGMTEPEALAADPGVRIHLGPFEKPTHILHIRPTGQLVDQITSTASTVRVVRTPGATPTQPTRWLAIVPLPDNAIENETTIRMSLTRISPSGTRSSWPRAMLPWQTEPGRLALDLSAWSGLEP